MPEIHFAISALVRMKGWQIPPKVISDLFYQRVLPDDSAPVIGGRRMVPESLIWLIESKLRATGKLPKQEVTIG